MDRYPYIEAERDLVFIWHSPGAPQRPCGPSFWSGEPRRDRFARTGAAWLQSRLRRPEYFGLDAAARALKLCSQRFRCDRHLLSAARELHPRLENNNQPAGPDSEAMGRQQFFWDNAMTATHLKDSLAHAGKTFHG